MKTMSKHIKAIAIVFALFAGVTSVFSQTENSKQKLPAFNAIVVNSVMDVVLKQDTENSISVSGDNLQDLKYEITDNVLYLKGKAGEDVSINVAKLNRLELLSNCDVKSSNQINSDKLDVILNGTASDVELNVKVKELHSVISGAGDIKYAGTANYHYAEIKGAGDVNAYNLTTDSTNILISGAGDAKINVVKKLTGIINGAGDVKYLKEPETKNVKINGFGSCRLKGNNKSDEEKTSKNYDTTKFNLGDYNVYMVKSSIGVNGKEKQRRDTIKDHNKIKIYWAGIGLGVNGYLNSANKTNVPSGYKFLDLDYSKSINVSLNFWEQRIPLWKNHVNIVTGMGFDISNYRFTNKNYKLLPDSNFVSAIRDTVNNYKKSKLVTTYLNVPLLLQFDTDPLGKHNRTIHLSAGLVGSMRIGSHTKQVYENGNTYSRPKTHDDFNLNPFGCSAMLRAGYGKIDIYASYSLSTLFRNNQGPQLYPFTVGITLASF